MDRIVNGENVGLSQYRERDKRLGNLNEVLEKNPFLSVVSSWKEECRKIRQNKMDGENESFVLGNDEAWIKEYNEKIRGKKEYDNLRLRINLIPQPFVGHPSAPIWILMLNPGYSERDEYDYLSVTELNKSRISKQIKKLKSPVFPIGEEWSLLEARQDALLEQLMLNRTSFHLLEKSFDSLRGLKYGGYKYWESHLFGKDEQYFMSWFKKEAYMTASNHVFVLEMMPYHSKHFDDSILTSKSWNESGYAIFWRNLVNYGIENNKVFFVRSPNKVIRQLSFDTSLEEICPKVCGRFLVLANPQGGRFNGRGLNVYVPLEDLMSNHVSMDQITRNMQATRNRLRDILPDNWDQTWRKCMAIDE